MRLILRHRWLIAELCGQRRTLGWQLNRPGFATAARIVWREVRDADLPLDLDVDVDAALADGALVEALGLAVEARTTAVLESALELTTGTATGTGTDCVIVSAPPDAVEHVGKHTAVGEALGRSALDAVAAGVAEWQRIREEAPQP